MKAEIHPKYFPQATVICACGNTWKVGSTLATVKTDICYNCHPFYTGEQRIVDTEGQVDRFLKKLGARQKFMEKREIQTAKAKPNNWALTELGLNKRAVEALAEGGYTTVQDVLDGLTSGGDEKLLALARFGRQSLTELKKAIRTLGLELPGSEAAE
jgi:large subunit ribosomal protein L31